MSLYSLQQANQKRVPGLEIGRPIQVGSALAEAHIVVEHEVAEEQLAAVSRVQGT